MSFLWFLVLGFGIGFGIWPLPFGSDNPFLPETAIFVNNNFELFFTYFCVQLCPGRSTSPRVLERGCFQPRRHRPRVKEQATTAFFHQKAVL